MTRARADDTDVCRVVSFHHMLLVGVGMSFGSDKVQRALLSGRQSIWTSCAKCCVCSTGPDSRRAQVLAQYQSQKVELFHSPMICRENIPDPGQARIAGRATASCSSSIIRLLGNGGVESSICGLRRLMPLDRQSSQTLR